MTAILKGLQMWKKVTSIFISVQYTYN